MDYQEAMEVLHLRRTLLNKEKELQQKEKELDAYKKREELIVFVCFITLASVIFLAL